MEPNASMLGSPAMLVKAPWFGETGDSSTLTFFWDIEWLRLSQRNVETNATEMISSILNSPSLAEMPKRQMHRIHVRRTSRTSCCWRDPLRPHGSDRNCFRHCSFRTLFNRTGLFFWCFFVFRWNGWTKNEKRVAKLLLEQIFYCLFRSFKKLCDFYVF